MKDIRRVDEFEAANDLVEKVLKVLIAGLGEGGGGGRTQEVARSKHRDTLTSTADY